MCFCLTWAEYHVPVVHACAGVENALHCEPGVEHVLGEHEAPHVAVVAGRVTNCKYLHLSSCPTLPVMSHSDGRGLIQC